jgi:hypothetical protein
LFVDPDTLPEFGKVLHDESHTQSAAVLVVVVGHVFFLIARPSCRHGGGRGAFSLFSNCTPNLVLVVVVEPRLGESGFLLCILLWVCIKILQ